jgi:hypothetical protein
MTPVVRSVVRVGLAGVIVLGSGCSIRATSQRAGAHQNDASADAHERIDHLVSIRPSRDGGATNPHESSFGTVQPDGTYCGVFCSENH